MAYSKETERENKALGDLLKGKTPEKRAAIVKTHFSNVRSDKISKAEKQIKEGKKTLKKMIDTGQAEEIGEGGKYGHKKKGFN